jgi:hypothetical protein
MEFGRIIFRKNGNWRIFLGKTHGKLAHLRNLSPKIIYVSPRVMSYPSRVTLIPISETLGWKSGALSLQNPHMIPTRATKLTNASKNEILALGDI